MDKKAAHDALAAAVKELLDIQVKWEGAFGSLERIAKENEAVIEAAKVWYEANVSDC